MTSSFPTLAAPVAKGRPAAGVALALAIPTLLLAFLWGRMVNHDTAWFLIATRGWLDGARLYVDIVEVNPPLNFYLTVPALILSDLTGISGPNAQYAVICVAMGLSLLTCLRLFPEELRLSGPRSAVALIGLAVAMILPAMNDIAQREQVMLILTAPWLIAQLPRRDPLPLNAILATAAIAGVGICLKPFFLLIPALVTLWQMVARRSLKPILSPANLTMGAVGLAYVGAAWALHPEYFRDVIPLARDVYGAIALSQDRTLGFLLITAAPFALFALLLLTGRNVPPGTGIFAAAALGGLASYIIQWNGFQYHTIPFEGFALMACFWVLAHGTRPTPLAVLAALALPGAGYVSFAQGLYRNPQLDELTASLDPAWQANGVLVLSTEVTAGPPLALALGTSWAGRYPHFWPIPGALSALAATDCATAPETCAHLDAILSRVRQDIITDIDTHRPNLLIFDRGYGFIKDRSFTWDSFMAPAPDWQTILKDYRPAPPSRHFDIWLRCTGATGAIAQGCASLPG